MQRHASLDASRSTDSLLPSPMLARMGSPPLPSPPILPTSAGFARDSEFGYASQMRTTSPMSICEDDKSRLDTSPSPLSPAGSRPASMLNSSSGIRMRSRVGSRVSELGPVSPPVLSPATAVSTPSDGRRNSSVTFAAPTSHAEHLHFARKSSPHHGVYGNNPDRRMSESAVEIMTIVREGEEMPSPRRAASDRPPSVGQLQQNSLEGDCTPVKRMKDAQRAATGVFTGQDPHASAGSGLPLPTRVPRSRHQSTSSTSAGSPASAADVMGLRTSPRLIRKRFSSASGASSSDRADTPVRTTSVSPTPSAFSEGASTFTHVPFPRGSSSIIRAKSKAGSPRTSDIPRLSIELETDKDEDEHSPSPHIDIRLAKSQPASALQGNLSPTSAPPVRPRQHKRWNSEVYDQPVGGSTLRQDPVALRSRHDSFMPPGSAGPYPTALSADRDDALSPVGNLRRRSTDKRQSIDGSRQRLVVKEPGKAATTYVST